MAKILPISRTLNFTPNTLGCCNGFKDELEYRNIVGTSGCSERVLYVVYAKKIEKLFRREFELR